MSVKEIYTRFDELKGYIDLAHAEMQAKATLWGVTGDSIIEMIDNLPF